MHKDFIQKWSEFFFDDFTQNILDIVLKDFQHLVLIAHSSPTHCPLIGCTLLTHHLHITCTLLVLHTQCLQGPPAAVHTLFSKQDTYELEKWSLFGHFTLFRAISLLIFLLQTSMLYPGPGGFSDAVYKMQDWVSTFEGGGSSGDGGGYEGSGRSGSGSGG